jgi:hypothetical protein
MRRGELVCMMGDRTYGSPAQKIPFLGGDAPFPIGGYVMAAIAGAPIVTVFSLRESGGHYHFFGFPPVPAASSAASSNAMLISGPVPRNLRSASKPSSNAIPSSGITFSRSGPSHRNSNPKSNSKAKFRNRRSRPSLRTRNTP